MGSPALRFLVDETSFELAGEPPPEALEDACRGFNELVLACKEKEGAVYRWSGIYDRDLWPGFPLHQFLYGVKYRQDFDHDSRSALMLALDRCIEWDEMVVPQPTGDVTIQGLSCWAPSISVTHQLLANRGAGCVGLGLRPDRRGRARVLSAGSEREVFFLVAVAELPEFYRMLFELEDLDSEKFMENAVYAFPQLVFAGGLASQVRRFKTRYREVRPEIARHLAVLNDHFRRIFEECRGDSSTVSNTLAAHGVDASLESPNTHASRKAMQQREVSFGGRTFVCEWHTKIRPTTDRIHFYPGDREKTGGKVLIGIFTDHLPT